MSLSQHFECRESVSTGPLCQWRAILEWLAYRDKRPAAAVYIQFSCCAFRPIYLVLNRLIKPKWNKRTTVFKTLDIFGRSNHFSLQVEVNWFWGSLWETGFLWVPWWNPFCYLDGRWRMAQWNCPFDPGRRELVAASSGSDDQKGWLVSDGVTPLFSGCFSVGRQLA